MNQPKQTFKTNVVYGLIVLIPIAIIALLVIEVAGLLRMAAEPLGLQSAWEIFLALLCAILALLVVCFVMGAIVRTRMGAWSFDKVEGKLFKLIPGYELLRNLLTGFVEKQNAYPAALVELHKGGASVLAFVMEEHAGGWYTVFAPLSPMISLGNVYIVEPERVTMLDAKALELTDCLAQWGVGSHKVVKDLKVK